MLNLKRAAFLILSTAITAGASAAGPTGERADFGAAAADGAAERTIVIKAGHEIRQCDRRRNRQVCRRRQGVQLALPHVAEHLPVPTGKDRTKGNAGQLRDRVRGA